MNASVAIHGELNEAFHVDRFSNIPDAQWEEVAAWLNMRVKAAKQWATRRQKP